MALTSTTVEMIVEQMAQLSESLVEIQSGSSNAMSAFGHGGYLELATLILDSGCL